VARLIRRIDPSNISYALGAESIPRQLVFLESGRRIRCATRKALEVAERLRGVSTVGVYAAKGMRGMYYLSIEGSQLLGPYLREGVVEVSVREAEEWMRGAPLGLRGTPGRVVVVRTGWLFLGSGLASRDGKVYPLIPRERMLVPEKGGKEGG